ncbi:MAG TPA: S1-like domain-containing RNA-binding protein [Puia sp.]|nr:S1-like domain-containing RNA-binding protein [Puia sp.]
MVQVGVFNNLVVKRQLNMGLILDDGAEGILLPKRFAPRNAKPGDLLRVFVYHDSEDRLIATTQHPKGILGDIVLLRVVSLTPQGAFLDWGLMKDLFVPKAKQLTGMRLGGDYLVKIYLDEQTGRLAATEKFEPFLTNNNLTVTDNDIVTLTVIRRTDIGYLCAINNRHTGVLHYNEVYRDIKVGDRFPGFIKNVLPANQSPSGETQIDVAAGRPGYARVEDAAAKVLRLLEENKGRLPYHDRSDPGAIYSFFGMSKKTFKMTTGKLYKERKIRITESGIELLTT